MDVYATAFLKYTNMWYYLLANEVSDTHKEAVYNYGILIIKMFPDYHHDIMESNLEKLELELELPRKVRQLCN